MAKEITAQQAQAAIAALRDAVANPTQFSKDIFAEVELIELNRFNSGFIQPPTLGAKLSLKKQRSMARRQIKKDLGAEGRGGSARENRAVIEELVGAALASGKVPTRKGGKKTLVDSGRLRDSVSGRFPESIREIQSGNLLRFGTRVPYARLHEFGGVAVSSHLQAFGRPTNPYTKVSSYPRRHFLGDFKPEEVARINRRIAENVRDRVQAAMGEAAVGKTGGRKE